MLHPKVSPTRFGCIHKSTDVTSGFIAKCFPYELVVHPRTKSFHIVCIFFKARCYCGILNPCQDRLAWFGVRPVSKAYFSSVVVVRDTFETAVQQIHFQSCVFVCRQCNAPAPTQRAMCNLARHVVVENGKVQVYSCHPFDTKYASVVFVATADGDT